MKKICLYLLYGILLFSKPAFAEISNTNNNNVNDKIVVNEFQILGNTVLQGKDLKEILKPFKDRRITYNELLEAVTEITKKYQEKGYFLTLAFLPPQNLDNGIIKIEIVEGYFEKINVEVTKGAVTSNYVKKRLKKIKGKPITKEELESALRVLLNKDLIQDLSIESIEKGDNTGLAVLNLKVVGQQKFSLTARTDNWQSPFLGTNNRIISSEIISLLKPGDRILIGYRNNNGSNAATVGYELPINTSDGVIRILGGNYASGIVAAPFNQPNPESNFRFARVEFSQPILETPSEKLAIGGGIGWKSNQDFLLGEPFPFSRGSDLEGRTTVTSLSFFQEYTRRSSLDLLRINSQFDLGVGILDANVGSRFDSEFLIWRGSAEYLLSIDENLQLNLRTGIQLANDEVPGLEQFNIGGPSTIPGYRSFLIAGDNGILGRADLKITLIQPKEGHSFQLVPFYAFGKTWNNNSFEPTIDDTITSAGIELVYLIDRKLEAKIGYGIPLKKNQNNNISNSLQENGFYFAVVYKIF